MNTDIHRLLDEAFTGVEMTPDAQDLKEEVRANLMSRVDELEASGHDPESAARQAIDELGDVRELLGETDAASPGAPAPQREGYTALALRHRVRPKPGFVLRVVVWTALLVAGIVLATFGATGVLPLPAGPIVVLLGIAATGLGLLVGDALGQETTTNHPMPSSRAGGYALASFLSLYGIGFVVLVALGTVPMWCIVFAALGVVGAVVLFAFLGTTQTNRKKAWVRTAWHGTPPNRFEEEPEAAARFGIYTVVIWVLTAAAYFGLVPFIGWLFATVAFLVGFAVWMLVLARMLFAPHARDR